MSLQHSQQGTNRTLAKKKEKQRDAIFTTAGHVNTIRKCDIRTEDRMPHY